MVYIKRLNKKILPFYLKPREDELFTSWIYRMSVKSGLKPIRFVTNYFSEISGFWNRDMDVLAPDHLIEYICTITPLNYNQVFNLTLRKYEGQAFEKLALNTYTPNISTLGINHRKRTKYGLLYCPSCLNLDKYYKTAWRLTTSILCLECKEYLIDRCPHCQSPITFFRISFNKKKEDNLSISICSECFKDITKGILNDTQPNKEEIFYQKFINKTIEKGYNEISAYSFTYIKVLLHLCSKLNTSNNRNIFNINFRNIYNISKTRTEVYFRFLPIEQKRELLVSANKFLLNFPKSLQNLREIKHFNNSHIIDNMEKMPFWFNYYLKFND